MNEHSEKHSASPYSALMCILMLLGTGVAVKIGAAVHLCHLGANSCGLAP